MTTPDWLEELAELEKWSTPTPWEFLQNDEGHSLVTHPSYQDTIIVCREGDSADDTLKLIAAMRNALPKLLQIAALAQRYFYLRKQLYRIGMAISKKPADSWRDVVAAEMQSVAIALDEALR